MFGRVGGYSDVKPMNEEILGIVEKAKNQMNFKSYEMFAPIEYKTQLVSGLNYKVKIQVDEEGTCIVVVIYKKFSDANLDNLEVKMLENTIKLPDEF